jgi:uncharacterized protein (TIGR03067 family)
MRNGLQVLGVLFAALAIPQAAAEIYKYTDPSGRVIYSDKPQPASSKAGDGGDGVFYDLSGVWLVANVTMEGAPDFDSKLAGSTWSFANNELSIERSNGETARYLVSIERAAKPRAFALMPVAPTTEPPGVMIYSRDGERLRVAFIDGMAGRPTGFEPRGKQIIVTLVARGSASANAKLRSACDILRAAGVFELLGSGADVDMTKSKDPAMQCRFAQAAGAVTLMLVKATERSTLDKERERQQKQAATRAVRTVVQDEPALGPSAFSVRMGNTITIMARRADVLVALVFEVPPEMHADTLSFARRVLERTT